MNFLGKVSTLRRRYGRMASFTSNVDEHAKTELQLYAENTSDLYNQKQSILANIRRRIAKGTYNHSLAPKLWLYWVDAAAKRYSKEFGPAVFNKATRMAVAQDLADNYRSGEE